MPDPVNVGVTCLALFILALGFVIIVFTQAWRKLSFKVRRRDTTWADLWDDLDPTVPLVAPPLRQWGRRRFLSGKTTACAIDTRGYDPEIGAATDERVLFEIHHEYSGLRVILGPAGGDHEPDVLIEKHPKEWVIYIHGNGGDPSAIVRISEAKCIVEDNLGHPIGEIEL